ncbi:MAG: DUF2723 domain-containing protein [Bacteroidetes bacterium]|nr:DUF2723 domain-containing protein [Bacteroidota bacterium]
MKGSRKPVAQTSFKSVNNKVPSNASTRFERLDFLIAGNLAAISFLIYFFTMSRSIPYIDGGELTTVLWTLGIAHPTGYPLFTLLGYAFVHIPISSEVAVRANLFAVACTALAGGLFYLAILRAHWALGAGDSASTAASQSKKTRGENRDRSLGNDSTTGFVVRLASADAALCLIFSATFWDQSTSIEVYPLQLALFALILIFWLKFYALPTRRQAFLAGLTLGLGFSNHMTTVLTVPAILFLLVLNYREKRMKTKLLSFTAAGAALPLLIYIYLPIRAAQSPILDWGNPDNLQRFIWHVTGKQFRTWMFSSFNVFRHQLGVFFSSLPSEFTISLVVVVLGIIIALLSRRRYFWWAILLLLGDIFYAANYNIHDILSYFLLAYIGLTLFAATGFEFIIQQIIRLSGTKYTVALLVLLLPVVSAALNYSNVNESDDFAVERYTRDILTSLPQNSLVLSFQWDDFVSASLYYQHVDKVRPDIIVIDKELLRRSWYANQIHTRYAYLFPNPDPIFSAYMDNLRLFENGLPYDPNSIEHTYSDFIREIIHGALRNGRDVFVGPEMENRYLYGYNKVPYGLLYELTNDSSYTSYGQEGLNGFRAAKKVDNVYSHQIENFYSQMFLARAAYEYRYGHLRRTLVWLDKTLEVDPGSQSALTAKIGIQQRLGYAR